MQEIVILLVAFAASMGNEGLGAGARRRRARASGGDSEPGFLGLERPVEPGHQRFQIGFFDGRAGPDSKPGGRVAVIDFFPERGPHRNDPSLQITKEQTRRLMSEAGLRLLAEHRLYDDKWFVIYGQ